MDFMLFRWMITPSVITIIWVIGVVLTTIFYVVGMVRWVSDWDDYYSRPDIWQSTVVFLVFILGWLTSILFFRVFLELVAVLFSILNLLRDIERRGRGM